MARCRASQPQRRRSRKPRIRLRYRPRLRRRVASGKRRLCARAFQGRAWSRRQPAGIDGPWQPWPDAGSCREQGLGRTCGRTTRILSRGSSRRSSGLPPVHRSPARSGHSPDETQSTVQCVRTRMGGRLGVDQGPLLPRRPQGHADHELDSCPRRVAGRCAHRGTRHHPPRHTPTPGADEPDGCGSPSAVPWRRNHRSGNSAPPGQLRRPDRTHHTEAQRERSRRHPGLAAHPRVLHGRAVTSVSTGNSDCGSRSYSNYGAMPGSRLCQATPILVRSSVCVSRRGILRRCRK